MLSQLDDVVAEFDDRGNKRRRHDQPRHDHQAMRSADPRAQYRPGPGPSDAFVALQEVSALICTPLSCHALAAHSPRPPRRWGFSASTSACRQLPGAMFGLFGLRQRDRPAHWPRHSTSSIHSRSFAVAVMSWCFDGHIQYLSESCHRVAFCLLTFGWPLAGGADMDGAAPTACPRVYVCSIPNMRLCLPGGAGAAE